MSAGIDALAHEVRPARGEPQGALVLLHGHDVDPVFLHVLRNWLADAVPAAQRGA